MTNKRKKRVFQDTLTYIDRGSNEKLEKKRCGEKRPKRVKTKRSDKRNEAEGRQLPRYFIPTMGDSTRKVQ